MKNVLGLDLGVGSIGWCLLEKEDNGTPLRIKKIGSRIVPLNSKEAGEYTKGNSISKNSDRTSKRTARKCYDRFQLRRYALSSLLKDKNMYPSLEQFHNLTPMDLWQLRADAATADCQLDLTEIGRVLLHINQKRGYKHIRVNSSSKEETDYVKSVNSRYTSLLEKGKTIGQFFADELRKSEHTNAVGKKYWTFRIKDQVYPRIAYRSETEKILKNQQTFYPSTLTDEVINEILDIIFYQRKLKSCKYLISKCSLEKRVINNNGKEVIVAPRVAPKSSPLEEISRLWETINNISITNSNKDEFFISEEQRMKIFEYLNNNEKLTKSQLYKILGIHQTDGWWTNIFNSTKAIKGNSTRCIIAKALGGLSKDDINKYMRFNIEFVEVADCETGEIYKEVSKAIIKEPLYMLWHKIYSIKDKEELVCALHKMGISDENTIEELCSIDFSKDGYANKSTKAMRRILPYLMDGQKYSEACESIGLRHSGYLTKEENENRVLKNHIPMIQKNELRQPVVEKVLNQMINLVNGLIVINGAPFDEIRIELARELRKGKQVRNEISKRQSSQKIENESIASKLKELNVTPTRNRIQKYKMWEESGHKCMYCGQPVNVSEFLAGAEVEVEHVIPKGLLFNNSFSNKVCSCRECNQNKGMRTAYDYMRQDKSDELKNYVDRVNSLLDEKKISLSKHDFLLASHEDYKTRKEKNEVTEDDRDLWENFIDRELAQSQYIARKATELLSQVCRNVYTTNGCVTDALRHIWGYDEVLHNLNLPRFREVDKTEFVEFKQENGIQRKERIVGWTKRIDNRHHAIDALTIASTSQSAIQRLSSLSANRDNIQKDVDESQRQWNEKRSLVEKWISIQPHLSYAEVEDAISKIIISVKAGRRTATRGKRYTYSHGKRTLVQQDILIPRAALHDEFVYGCISRYKKNSKGTELEDRIVRKYTMAIGSQGCVFTGKEKYEEKVKEDKNGIKTTVINDQIKKVLDNIVDAGVRARILERLNRNIDGGYKADYKKAINNLKNLGEEPIYIDKEKTRPIKSVRMFTNSTSAIPVRYNKDGVPVSYVEPGNNHHLAIYIDCEGVYKESIVSMWQAIERKRYGLPLIITSPSEVWTSVQDRTNIPENVLSTLPDDNTNLFMVLQINDMVILGMPEDEYQRAVSDKDIQALEGYLYIVQNISSNQYRFRRHTEAQFDISNMNKKDKRFYNIQSMAALRELNPHKIQVDMYGELIPLQ